MDLTNVSTLTLLAEVANRHMVVYIVGLIVLSEFCRFLADKYVRPLVWHIARTPKRGEILLRFPKAGVYKVPPLKFEIGAGEIYVGKQVYVAAFTIDKVVTPAVQPPA